MSVKSLESIDFISINEGEEVILTISDHLDWGIMSIFARTALPFATVYGWSRKS